jgi:hypothetical protein
MTNPDEACDDAFWHAPYWRTTMSYRHLACVAVFASVAASTVLEAGQRAAARATSNTSAAPRTPWGDPDLQGIWKTSGATPLERPSAYAGREQLTDQELKALVDRQNTDREEASPRAGDPGTYNRFWSDTGAPTNQTSLIVEPPDGRLPALTAEGLRATRTWNRGSDDPEDRHLWERCITRGGMPNAMMPRAYNNNAQIVQAPGYVVIVLEQIHEARIIPLDGRPHLPPRVQQWLGDPRGRWEGDTLVVESRHFADNVTALQPWANFNSRQGSGKQLQIIERFRRVDASTIDYRMTVDDPQMYTKPWTVRIPMQLTGDLIYEYACHEANYGMEGILKGGRFEDKSPGGAGNR